MLYTLISYTPDSIHRHSKHSMLCQAYICYCSLWLFCFVLCLWSPLKNKRLVVYILKSAWQYCNHLMDRDLRIPMLILNSQLQQLQGTVCSLFFCNMCPLPNNLSMNSRFPILEIIYIKYIHYLTLFFTTGAMTTTFLFLIVTNTIAINWTLSASERFLWSTYANTRWPRLPSFPSTLLEYLRC